MTTHPASTLTLLCPQIGTKYDPTSLVSVPSTHNYCHHCNAPASPLTEHQRVYCLGKNFSECPVYSRPAAESFPRELLNLQPHRWGRNCSGLYRLWRRLKRWFSSLP